VGLSGAKKKNWRKGEGGGAEAMQHLVKSHRDRKNLLEPETCFKKSIPRSGGEEARRERYPQPGTETGTAKEYTPTKKQQWNR